MRGLIPIRQRSLRAMGREPEAWTIRRVLEWTSGYLRRGGVETARFEAELLLAHALRTERLHLYLNPDRPLSEAERARFRELVQKRRRGVPLAYLLGSVEFMDVTLRVDRRVLIPRVETEELVEVILKDCDSEAQARGESWCLLDLGTGSGAIVIALLKRWPRARAVAVDLSQGALELARENARENGVEERIRWVRTDWLAGLRGRFDLIVSNPPYVPTEEYAHLPREVRVYEPRLALDGGPRGLRELQRIAQEAPKHLAPGGRLYLEIGAQQAEDVRALLEQTQAFSSVEVLPDLAGRDRFVRARGRSPGEGVAACR